MKKTITKPNPKPHLTMDNVMAAMNKKFGEGTMSWGDSLPQDTPRVPFGVFAVDFASGGGLPLWQMTQLWGEEQGGKTLLAIKAMRSVALICWRCFSPLAYCTCSVKSLIMASSFAAAEGTLEKSWVQDCGVPPKTFQVSICKSGEEYIDTAERILTADNCGLLVVDSLVALTPEDELESSASQRYMGNQPKLITRFVMKLISRLQREKLRGHPCAVLFTNQMRKQLGMMFGNPESVPGGHAARHMMSLTIRCVKKGLHKKVKEESEGIVTGDEGVDKYVSEERKKEQASRHSFSIKKDKVMTLAESGEYILVKENIPSTGLTKGTIDDFHILYKYALKHEVVKKAGSEYRYFNIKAKTPEQIKTLWKKKPEEYLRTDIEIVRRAKAQLIQKVKEEEKNA